MDRRLLAPVPALALLALVVAFVHASAELPGYETYAVPGSLQEIMVNMIGNATISGSSGAFTIADVADNQSTIILLNPLFAYEITGQGIVGLAYANGTVAVNFSLAEGPVVIEPHELYTVENQDYCRCTISCDRNN